MTQDINKARHAEFPGTWVIIGQANSARRAIGRVAGCDGTKVPNEVSVEHMLAAKYLTLNPMVDFFIIDRQVAVRGRDGKPQMGPDGSPAMAISREPMVTPRGFDQHPSDVHVFIGPGIEIEALSQKHGSDASTYMAFVDDALERMEQTRARALGLALPNDRR